mgnify:CR=1 FL=1
MSESEEIQQVMREEQRRNKPKPPRDLQKMKDQQERERDLLRHAREMHWKDFERQVVIGIHGAMPGTPEHADFRSLYLECQKHL